MTRAALLPLVLMFALAPQVCAQEPTPAQREFFEKKVRPVLVEHCFKCHSHDAKKLRGGLFLDSRAAILQGGDNGPALVPGQPEKSRLVEALHYKNPDLQMPPESKLPAAVIADLEKWVKDGAPWPGDSGKVAAKGAFDLAKRKQDHWAWQPVKAAPPPAVKDKAWPRDPIDAFLLAKLEEKNLKPAAPADRRTLIRRLSFDLVGLPPTPAEVEAFVKDASPQALENLVDGLLARPQFGERWGRHWLDLTRYAESRGHEFDYNNPNAYQYRDYVIRALNGDVPYNQFVIEHLAGDLLAKPRLHPQQGFNESIIGTGFYFMGEQIHSPVDTTSDKADRFDNTIDVIGKTFLGLTVACARCHDHKFDAISTKDYYALFGFLESSSYRQVAFDTLEHNRRIAGELADLRTRARKAMQKELADAAQPGLTAMPEYLRASREVFAGAKVEVIATKHKLDLELLKRWQAHLALAAKDENEPLHLLALVVTQPDMTKEKLTAHLTRTEARIIKSARTLAELDVVADYRQADPEIWLTDGFAFGPGVMEPGMLRLTNDGGKPGVAFAEFGAAVADRAWDGLKPAAGVDGEPGRLGKTFRSGRSLRTPSFTVLPGRVFYLVRGAAFVNAGVDGHVMQEGPLHGQLVQSINTGGKFQWVEHNLKPYAGKRAFLEFTPTPGTDFAIALVVQGATAPDAFQTTSPWVIETVKDIGEPARLLALYPKMFAAITLHLRNDTFHTAGPAPEIVRMTNWLFLQGKLLAADPAAVEKRVREAAAPFVAEEAKLVAQIKKESLLAPGILDGSGVDESVYIRGSYKAPGDKVPRRFLEALGGKKPLEVEKGSGRLELAQQITDPNVNPLIARVMVNRLWHHLFGRGIVASTDNFGVLGDRPTHPELLDHLADRFVKEGWSLKKMIRNLVLTRAYQMSNQRDQAAEAADPENLLLHRANLRRLEGEAIRDAMLAVSGRLDARQFGPPVPVNLTAFQDGRGKPASGPVDGNGRRSVYLSVRRNFLPQFFLAFDMPTPFSTVGRRTVSNVPAQALILLNDPFVHQQADLWARRTLKEKQTPQERIAFMYESAFSRPPTAFESWNCLAFLENQARLNPANAQAGWTDLAHVLFNTKEFIYLP